MDASANSDVKLQFPVSLASKTVTVAAMDGGTLTGGGGTSSIGGDGSLSFSFQVSDQPGVHRVIVIDPNAGEDDPIYYRSRAIRGAQPGKLGGITR